MLVERGQGRVLTRKGYDWTSRYPYIVSAAANLACQSAIIDGEAIQDENGVSDFDALGSALWRCPHAIMLYAFNDSPSKNTFPTRKRLHTNADMCTAATRGCSYCGRWFWLRRHH